MQNQIDLLHYGANIRVIPGDTPLISVIDVISSVTGQNNDNAGKKFRRIYDNHSIQSKLIQYVKFEGQGQRKTPVTDLNTINEICQLLPKKRTIDEETGYIYLVQPAYAKEDNFKVGMTIYKKSKNLRYPPRVSSYGKKARVFLCQKVSKRSVKAIEKEIIKRFKVNFTNVEGSEWFKGDVNAMLEIINHVVQHSANFKDVIVPRIVQSESMV